MQSFRVLKRYVWHGHVREHDFLCSSLSACGLASDQLLPVKSQLRGFFLADSVMRSCVTTATSKHIVIMSMASLSVLADYRHQTVS